MRRRGFLSLLGGAALGWSIAARAQQRDKVYRIGYLSVGSPADEAARFDSFRAGLATLGYVEGKNLVIESRWLDGGNYARLPELAGQLVDLKVEAIVTYSTPGVRAAKAATASIPIVFATVGDAVAVGVVSGLARPGGNVTGTTYFTPELAAKRLELLKEAMPGLGRVGILFNPANPATAPIISSLRRSAQSLALELTEFPASEAVDLERVFESMPAKTVTGLVVAEDPMLIYNAATCAQLALKHRLASCGFPELAERGGFAAYGIDFVEMWRRAATFVDKILKGAKPSDLPVEQATKFVTAVNLKTAQELGIAVPPTLLARADEVIE